MPDDILPKTFNLLIEQLPPQDREDMAHKIERLIKKIWSQGYHEGYSDGMEEIQAIDEIVETPLRRINTKEL